MARRWLMCAGLVIALTFASRSLAQDWQFTRSAETNQVGVTLFAGAIAGDSVDNDGFALNGDDFIGLGASASASDPTPPSASVQNVGAASAMNLTPNNESTLLPTVDTTVSQTQILTSDGNKRATTLENTAAITNAAGNYQLTGTSPNGFLRGSIYLVGIQNLSASGDGQIGGPLNIAATVNEFGANAQYNVATGLWTVNVTLPDFTTTFTAAGVNQFYTFSIPVTLPFNVGITANSTSNLSGVAGLAGGGSAQSQVGLSASAWAQFTPTDDPPPGGDFNGDLVVDGSDFLLWQRGFGDINGSTLAQGDANHDGAVDGSDLDVWKLNFGSSPPVVAIQIPEPTAYLTFLAGVAFIVGQRRLARA